MKRIRPSAKWKNFILDALLLTLGSLLMSVGIYFFKMSNGFATGGVSGLAITLSWLTVGALTPATIMLIANVALLILGFLFLGKEVGAKTVYCSLFLSVMTKAFEYIPLTIPFSRDPLLELIYAIMLEAIGSSILFYRSASSGGTDIPAMILKKYTAMDIGKALLAVDFLIAATSFFTYGMEIGLYSVLGLCAKAFLVDTIIESISLCKSFQIITEHPDEVIHHVLHIVHHGVTVVDAIGAYTGKPKKMILTVCRRAEAAKLSKQVRQIDPGAFITITNSGKIIGQGFHSV